MKRFTEYTYDELVKLTQSEIETLVDLECAHEGIPLLPPEVPVKPYKPKDVEPDVTYYQFSHYPAFVTREDAWAASELLKQFDMPNTEWCYGRGKSYDLYKGVKKRPETDISAKEAYTESHYAQVAEAKSRYEMDEAAYNEANTEYKDIEKKRAAVSQDVFKHIAEAKAHFAKIKRYCDEFRRYLKLAEGSRQIAWNFMKSAHPDEEEFIESEVRVHLAVDAVVESAHASEEI